MVKIVLAGSVKPRGRSLHKTGRCRNLRITVRARDEFAVLIGLQQRHVVDIEVGQDDAEHLEGLRLDFGPVADRAGDGTARRAAVEHLASADGVTSSIQHVFAQEHLVRGMRGIGLVLVDERGRGVFVLRYGRSAVGSAW